MREHIKNQLSSTSEVGRCLTGTRIALQKSRENDDLSVYLYSIVGNQRMMWLMQSPPNSFEYSAEVPAPGAIPILPAPMQTSADGTIQPKLQKKREQQHESYPPYGSTAFRSVEEPIYGFSGEEVEEESELGLIRYGARWYASALERWVSANSLFLETPKKNTESMIESGLHSYSANKSINLSDLDGLQMDAKKLKSLNSEKWNVSFFPEDGEYRVGLPSEETAREWWKTKEGREWAKKEYNAYYDDYMKKTGGQPPWYNTNPLKQSNYLMEVDAKQYAMWAIDNLDALLEHGGIIGESITQSGGDVVGGLRASLKRYTNVMSYRSEGMQSDAEIISHGGKATEKNLERVNFVYNLSQHTKRGLAYEQNDKMMLTVMTAFNEAGWKGKQNENGKWELVKIKTPKDTSENE